MRLILIAITGFLFSYTITRVFLSWAAEPAFDPVTDSLDEILFPGSRRKKFIHVCGQRFHPKVLSQYIGDGFTLLLTRQETDEILRWLNRKFIASFSSGRSYQGIVRDLVEYPKGFNNLFGHKKAALLHLLSHAGERSESCWRSGDSIARKRFSPYPGSIDCKAFRLMKNFICIQDKPNGKRVYLAIGLDFLPIEDLTVEFPFHSEIPPHTDNCIHNCHNRAAND